MTHFKGIGEHSVFELEKIILEQQKQLHQNQIEIQKMTDWVSIKEKLPPEYDNVLIINSDLEIFVAAYDPIMNDFEGFYGTVTHWRLIFRLMPNVYAMNSGGFGTTHFKFSTNEIKTYKL